MAKERRPYIDFEYDGETYAFRLNALDVAQLQSMVQAPEGILRALSALRFDVIFAATVRGLSNPRNPKGMQKVARSAFESDWQYCAEKVMEALEAGGVLEVSEDEDDGENPTRATGSKKNAASGLTSTD